jgi:hypothetical protein
VTAFAAVLWALVLVGGGVGAKGELERILERHQQQLGPVVERSEELRLQLVLARVVEPKDKPPVLQRSTWRADAEYFYPASAIKLCAAVAALEQLGGELSHGQPAPEGDPLSGRRVPVSPEALLDARLRLEPVRAGAPVRDADPSNADGGGITVRHEVRKLCLVSDNEAFNRLYDLVGQRALNERMWAAGLDSARLRHRLSIRSSPEENRRTPGVRLELEGGDALLLPERFSDLQLDVPRLKGLDIGQAFREDDGGVVEGPVSFREKNRMSLSDLQDLLVKVVRPDVDLGTPGFALSDAQRALLVEAMTQLPRESANPRYDPERYPDDYVKFLLPGLRRVIPAERLRVTNKVGLAYGFTVENAYVEDSASGRGFFLAGTLYTNANGVLNDGVYEYDTLALPFWADLGEVLARELLLGPGSR